MVVHAMPAPVRSRRCHIGKLRRPTSLRGHASRACEGGLTKQRASHPSTLQRVGVSGPRVEVVAAV